MRRAQQADVPPRVQLRELPVRLLTVVWTDEAGAPAGFLREEDLDPDPFAQFGTWYRAALDAGLHRADAMTLATATAEGAPSARMVLLKELDHRGFVFYTNYASRKGLELAANPRAALVFHWSEQHRQVRITGSVERLPRDISERYFATRPRGAQLAAWASRQSEVIRDRASLERRFVQLEAEYRGRVVPLPEHWGGFRLVPDSFEFWQGRENRLHDRLRYLPRDGGWKYQRLAP